MFRHYPKQNVCFGCFASIPKQRVSMFRLNRNKQKTNRNSLKGSIFSNFLQKIYSFFNFSVFSGFFSVFSVCFETVCFGVSIVSLLYQNREFWLIRNKQKTHPNSLKESIFGYFSENSGLFRFVMKQFCLFRLFRYRFETPKQTETFCFWFHETNRNKRETDLVSVCQGQALARDGPSQSSSGKDISGEDFDTYNIYKWTKKPMIRKWI